MEPPASSRVVRFGAFAVGLRERELRKRGRKIRLQQQPFEVLVTLLQRPGELVTREELRQRLWPADTFVDFNHGLNNAINRLREALCDSADKPLFIETVPRRGYRFIAHLSDQDLLLLANGSPYERALPADLSKAFAGIQSSETCAAETVEHRPNDVSPLRDKSIPAQTRRLLPPAAAILLSLVIALPFLVWYWANVQHRLASSGRVRSIVVLPLTNLSGDMAQEYFVDGMTDELITELAKISSLRVISRTSSMRYKGNHKPLADIARELNVDAVLEGSVMRSAGRVRITAQLIHAATGRHIWAESYSRDVRDVMALQNELCMAIARRIQAEVTPRDQTRAIHAHVAAPEAYEAYLWGRYFLGGRNRAALKKSVAYFQRAIEIDPRCALAFAGLADAYNLLGGWAFVAASETLPKARASAKAAPEIDDTLAEAHTSLGFSAFAFDYDWSGAERDFQRAVDLNPNYASAFHWYAVYLLNVGKPQAAIAATERARELDPVSVAVNMTLGQVYVLAREYDRGIEQCRKTLELDSNFAGAYWCIAWGYTGKKMYREALAELSKAEALGLGPLASGQRGYLCAITGDTKQARNVLKQMLAASPDSYRYTYEIALVYAGLGEQEHAFQWLDKAYEERDLLFLKADPYLDSLRSDSRFLQLVRRIGLSP